MVVLGRMVMLLLAVALAPAAGLAAVERHTFATDSAYLVVEILADDLVHFEAAAGAAPPVDQPIYTSPMVFKTDHDGPSSFHRDGTTLETPDVRLEVNAGNLCVEVRDRVREAYLTTFCPVALDSVDSPKGLDIDPGAVTHVYGLGQQFLRPGSADGDWLELGVREGAFPFGNQLQGFEHAAVGNVQIPVYYALGPEGLNYAVLVDNVYWQRWDFRAFWWQARMFGDQLRWYVMTGPDLADLRADFMALTGRPPVPPRKAFGLWVSEFGYDNFGEIDDLLDGLRREGFPVDGFVLDLNWFGGIDPIDTHGDPPHVRRAKADRSHMGRLDWDEDQDEADLATNKYSFPNPGGRIQEYHADRIGLCVIEESYIADVTDTFAEMPEQLAAYRRTEGVCDPAHRRAVDDILGFWGIGRMVDWSNTEAGVWIHEQRRFPNLSQLGVSCHWTDLGEPESFDAGACYEGVETVDGAIKNHHADVHNLYNLLWNRSIWDGYVDKEGEVDDLGIARPRPFVLSRSGAAGSQRYGVAMWSGDIASSLASLATHLNAQMHMSLSGIDYYGADVGGFRRERLPHNDDHGGYRGFEDELYTQWLANAAWLDVPVRPHVDNEFKPFKEYATAPHLVGKVDSNLANLRQRYELIPYYYSLAHRAHQTGAPVVPPPVFHYQDDPNVRGMGHQKMIGRALMVGVVARHGEYARDVYLPAGRWADYHTNEWLESAGEVLRDVPVYRDGILRLPAFARAGAILPLMAVDERTEDAFGHRIGEAEPPRDLIVRVYADPTDSAFTLYEDDGWTVQYDDGRPFYRHRTTRISQQQTGPLSVEVAIRPAVGVHGGYDGAIAMRANVVELVVDDAEAVEVILNGVPLAEHPTRAAFDAAASGWVNAGRNLVLARSDPLPVEDAKTFEFSLRAIDPRTSVHFVCDNGFTELGRSVFVVGSIPELGDWDPTRAIKLDPNIYYEYIYAPPPGGQHAGPTQPVWTGVVADLPPSPSLEWKCLRLDDDGSGEADWQPGANNVFDAAAASGHAGQAYGRF
jgi:alpha-glucosidase (family GH31 glycosyl hydrolase)